MSLFVLRVPGLNAPRCCCSLPPPQDLTTESVVKLVDQLKAGGTASIAKKGSQMRDKAEPFGASRCTRLNRARRYLGFRL